MPPPKSPAYWFCVDLVAFLAEADGAIGVDAARLYMELIRALTALPARETLVGHAFCKTALEARDAAEAYFSHVLDDTLAPVRGAAHTVAHSALALVLAAGAAEGATLTEAPMDDGATALPFDRRLRSLRLALRRLVAERGAGPGLAVGEVVLTLPRALGLWDALRLPAPLKAPATPLDAARLAAALGKTLESLGRHWKELVVAGLVPPQHWLETTTINQLRALNRFRRLVESFPLDRDAALAQAWAASPVPGFATVDEVLESDLWRLSVHKGWRSGAVAVDDPGAIPIEDDETPETKVIASIDFDRRVARLLEDKVIDQIDALIFTALKAGAVYADLAEEAAVAGRLAQTGLTLESYAIDLAARVHAVVTGWTH